MFSTKKNILQTVALVKAYGIKDIVLSPGSRNAPIMQTFSQDTFFDCHVIVDERNAAFYALGIIQAKQCPVIICCTSGSALLNYAPAVSEAFYQQLPLVVITADRSHEWIGQMDGQTLRQPGIFGSMVKKSINLPEIKNDSDEWFCNRLLNEALISCTTNALGPVQINIPLSEPLFDYSATVLPEVRKIHYAEVQKKANIQYYAEQWKKLPKRIIVIGQMFYSEQLIKTIEKFAEDHNCIILAEYLSNCISSKFIFNFDTLLYKLSDEEKEEYKPDLLVTLGGHIVSKRLKHFFRQYKPKSHWLLTKSGEVVDLFQSLTDVLEVNEIEFLCDLQENIQPKEGNTFSDIWNNTTSQIDVPSNEIPYSDIWVTGRFLKAIPKSSNLHLANSSAVRNAQLYPMHPSLRIFCNRGVNGIESTLPTTIGFAAVYSKPVYLIIGDLSFFYGLNALWNINHIKNLRILLINNGGGGIFHLLPGLNKSESLHEFVAAQHITESENWVKAAGFQYLSSKNKKEFKEHLTIFTDEHVEQSIILEVIVDMNTCKATFQEYYHSLKNN